MDQMTVRCAQYFTVRLQDLPRSDNFVTVRLLDQLKRSDVVFGSTCPRWNQVISLDLHEAPDRDNADSAAAPTTGNPHLRCSA
jgi:hypothetical protein